jgi:NADH-quinone oxidoreductase subunit E
MNWLPRHVLRWLAMRLNIPLLNIYSIANFYGAFSLRPQGKHTIQVCMGTACHVRGAPELLAKVSAVLGIKPGETDPKQLFTLKTVNCMGCCALAPVLKIDDEYFSNPKMDELKEIVNSFERKEVSPWQN